MTAEPNIEQELLRLCGLVADGQLGETDSQRLSELLSAEASARAFYRSYMDAHARLLLHYEPVPVVDEPAEKRVDRFLAEPAPRFARQSSWWRVATMAASLAIGLNVVQSATNLELVGNATRGRVVVISDAEAQRLADEIEGLTASEAKRLALFASQREETLMLPLFDRQPLRERMDLEP